MSVETLAIAKLIEEGGAGLRRLYSSGISAQDFSLYEDEFRWVERRVYQRKPLNRRTFRQKFPDFEWNGVPSEEIADLAAELKEERAYEELTKVLSTIGDSLEPDNALDLAIQMREHLADVTKKFHPLADVELDADVLGVIEEMRKGMALAKAGLTAGIPTGFAHLDHHWGGMMPGVFIEILGRTGEGKSLKINHMGWTAKKNGFKVGMFTPEFNEHEARCRYHCIASADRKVQAEVGLERSFRHRALLFRHGFNLKTYQRFMEYLRDSPGRMHLLSGVHMRDKMSVGYIEDRLVELELDLVLVDPIYLLKPVRTTRDGNGWQEVAWTAEALHHLSEQYNIPIVFTNQANDKQKGSAREDAPHKSDTFGAQAMTHIVDYVLGVKHVSEENHMICRGTKSRFGQNFRYDLALYANTGVIKEKTPLKGSYFNGHEDKDDEELKEMVANAVGADDD